MTDVPIRDAPTRDALIALHFQNDICHPQGRIPFSLDRDSSEAARFLDASKRALGAARHAGWTVVHMHIVFAEDYSACAIVLCSRRPKRWARSSAAPGGPRLSMVSSPAVEKSSSPATATAPSGGPAWRGGSADL